MKPRKKPLSPEEQYQIEKAVVREEWKERGCPCFKKGPHTDKRKEENKRRCREKIQPDE